MVGQGEIDRYLRVTVPALLEFCDEVRVVCEATDESCGWLQAHDRVVVDDAEPGSFFVHEGRARQRLLDFTLAGKPTHILAVDADEIVTDGQAVRSACELNQGVGVWTLGIQEVWKADAGSLWLRCDGGWDMQARAPVLYRAPRVGGRLWRIPDRQLACGREPVAVRQVAGRAIRLPVELLHFGWTNVDERAARYQRYVDHDGGRFHARQHLDSIMWPDRKVRLARRDWPAGVDREVLLARIGRQVAA